MCDRASKTLAGDMADVARTGAAKRRRERRLRSWLRHERMTVAAELSAALHHSRDGGQVSRVGLRAQKMDSSRGGRRPGVPEDPGPPQLGVERAACPRSTGLPPLPDLCSGEVHDATLVKFLLRQTLLQRKKEEEERNKEEEEEKEQFLEQSMQELRLLSKTPLAGRSLQQTNRMMELLKLRDAASSSSSKRKRKKRKKKKLPRCLSSRGRARRRQRQCLLSGCSVFLSIDN